MERKKLIFADNSCKWCWSIKLTTKLSCSFPTLLGCFERGNKRNLDACTMHKSKNCT